MPAHSVRNTQEVYSRVSHEGTGRVFHTWRITHSPTAPKEMGSWGTLHPGKVLQGAAQVLEPTLTNISVLPTSTDLMLGAEKPSLWSFPLQHAFYDRTTPV